jgi:putative PIN family toxin of toxin-antitoxin system
MKIVLDCNVIISAGLTDGVCRKVLWEVIQNHILYISEDILMEYKEVISREKFKTAKRYLYSLIEMICEVSELVVVEKFEFTLPDGGSAV